MTFFILLIVLVIVLFLFFKFIKGFAKISYNQVLGIFGGVKSGKTLLGVRIAIKQFKISQKYWSKKKRRVIYLNFLISIVNRFRKNKIKLKELPLMPQFYSNIPIKVSKKYGMSLRVNKELFKLKEKLPNGSIMLLDEFGTIASQYGYTEEQIRTDISEFVRFYGHYTKNKGLLIVIDQSTDRILKEVRVALGAVYETSDFSKIGFIGKQKIIKYQNSIQVEYAVQKEQIKNKYYLLFKKNYDPYCYSERVKDLPLVKAVDSADNLKENELLRLDNLRSSLDKSIQKSKKIHVSMSPTKELNIEKGGK